MQPFSTVASCRGIHTLMPFASRAGSQLGLVLVQRRRGADAGRLHDGVAAHPQLGDAEQLPGDLGGVPPVEGVRQLGGVLLRPFDLRQDGLFALLVGPGEVELVALLAPGAGGEDAS